MDTPFVVPPRQERLRALVAAPGDEQPPLVPHRRVGVAAAIASLALGGAERIVLDWAAGCAARFRVTLIVLRDAAHEWPLPPGVEVVRLSGSDLERRLEAQGAAIAASGNGVVLCHLLTATERAALERGGAHPLPVLHNAAAGWREAAAALSDCREAIAVSRHAAHELHASGWRGACAVIRHVPSTPARLSGARSEWRARWAIPQDALVIGMVGAVKPQKAYTRALRILAAVERRDAHLVIVGGPVGRDGDLAWRAAIAQACRLGLEHRVRLPGFIDGAADCLPAFDLVLDSSRYEGLSIATLEALAAGLPVVASAVGGQGELPAPGLTLVPFDAPDEQWTGAIDAALKDPPALPAWRGAPAHRLWTLFHLRAPFVPGEAVLFVTANLNAGGAQRSLVNLALALNTTFDFEIAVCGSSSSTHFTGKLLESGVRVRMTAASRDCFDHAEAIVQHVVARRIGTLCFWNVDAKVKLLLAKAFAASRVRLIDVSPGAYSFEEMEATREFQTWVGYDSDDYHARLDALVLKYRGPPPACRRVTVIPNGVPLPRPAAAGSTSVPRIAMSGRIAPTKFLVEAVAAMRLVWREHAAAELHLFGAAEERHAAYAVELHEAAGDELGVRVFFHGAAFDAPERIAGYTAALVLGENQGCPDAVLEALAAGVPVVANDSGGTRELVIDGRTGILLPARDPATIAAGLSRVIRDPRLARRLSERGQRHVERSFSMARMAAAYRKLFLANREARCTY